jgi:hypothetical protein
VWGGYRAEGRLRVLNQRLTGDLMILHDDNLVFVHIQKTGGTAVSFALGVEDNLPEKHRTAMELKLLYGSEAWDKSFKFAFVRNPWDRLVSWWSMIDGHRDNFKRTGSANLFFRYVLEHANSFEEFLLNCQNVISDNDGVKSIFKNQIDYLTDDNGNIMVDFIGRFENLSHDFSIVTQKIYGHPKILPVINRSVHNHYRDYYDDHTRLLVENAYQRDLEVFGYQF